MERATTHLRRVRGIASKSPKIVVVMAVALALQATFVPTAGADASSVTRWTQVTPATNPPGRADAAMTYDPATGNVVLFSGAGAGPADTWIWDGTTWTQQFPATSPPARYGASMAYDAATGNVVLFGGCDKSPFDQCGAFDDTWTWDGVTWTQQFPTSSPPPSYWASMAFDPATDNMVLYTAPNGTDSVSTWTWDGSNWTEQSPATTPPARVVASMAYDPAIGALVLFGGQGYTGDLNDTWTWDGSTWTEQMPSTSPAARVDAAMAFDPSMDGLVLFGGYGPLGDTWTYDGSNWVQQSPVSSPPARVGAAMSYDAATGNLVLFGGLDASNSFRNDTWIDSVAPLITPNTPTISNLPSSSLASDPFTAAVDTNGDGLKSVTSSTPSVCVVSGLAVSYAGAGTCTLTAHVSQGTYYAAADGAPQSFSVSLATPTTPSISNLPSVGSRGGFDANVSTTSDGATSVTSETTSVCTTSGLIVSYVANGTCTLMAHVAESGHYAAADGAPQSMPVYVVPSVISFSPTRGPVGTVVTIKGANLSGATKVTFNGVKGTIASDSAAKLKVKVPAGSTTGKIKVVTPGGLVKTVTSFTVT